MPNSIQYRYALCGTRVANIISGDVTSDKNYHCLACSQTLIPVLKDDHRQRYFRHKTTATCSGETYLHNLAKHMFYQTYQDLRRVRQPFIFEVKVPVNCIACSSEPGPCTINHRTEQIDLIHHFKDRISLEERDGEFVPDVLLKTNHETMYIEFAVTHNCSEKKINSAVPILEIQIRDEADITMITSGYISENRENVTVHNLKTEPISGDFAKSCKKMIKSFVVDANGACMLADISVPKFNTLSASDNAIAVSDSSTQTYVKLVTKFFLSNRKILDCWLCQSHHLRKRADQLNTTYDDGCWLRTQKLLSSTCVATDCADFKPIIDIPESGLYQAAVDKITKSLSTPKPKSKVIASYKQVPVKPRPEPTPEPEHRLEVVYYGQTVTCTKCCAKISLITSAKITHRLDLWRSFQILQDGPTYARKLLNKILAMTEFNDSNTVKTGTLAKRASVPILRCPDCETVNLLSADSVPACITESRPIIHGLVIDAAYKAAGFLDHDYALQKSLRAKG